MGEMVGCLGKWVGPPTLPTAHPTQPPGKAGFKLATEFTRLWQFGREGCLASKEFGSSVMREMGRVWAELGSSAVLATKFRTVAHTVLPASKEAGRRLPACLPASASTVKQADHQPACIYACLPACAALRLPSSPLAPPCHRRCLPALIFTRRRCGSSHGSWFWMR
ncbi:hypothetical protein HaLaN_21333 [Haematococcus lacustris]|uniref:Uncharacterized protein n=1 Tax=Haematococcus lacustris TaxID=44745 RepID=A0A699ZRD1_HAELA|nr:hypothetical protein HaLaN_21333 [Haematococcus lacustris]